MSELHWHSMTDPKPNDSRPVLVAYSKGDGFDMARWSPRQNDWVTVNDYEAEWGDGRITHWADPLLPTGQVTDWPDFQREDLS